MSKKPSRSSLNPNPEKTKSKIRISQLSSYENSGTRFNPGPDEKPKSKNPVSVETL